MREEDGPTFVVANDDPAEATREMLRDALEMIGHIGSRYDEWRVRVIMEHGDKWIAPGTPPEEW